MSRRVVLLMVLGVTCFSSGICSDFSICTIRQILVSGYPYGVNISDIKSTSAVLHWKTTELEVEEFLVLYIHYNNPYTDHII